MKATRTMQTLRLFILLLLLYIRSSFPLGLKFVRPSRPLHSLKIRGSSKAYTLANSTAIDAAKAVNAPPPSTRAPRMVWKGAWEFGKRAMKVRGGGGAKDSWSEAAAKIACHPLIYIVTFNSSLAPPYRRCYTSLTSHQAMSPLITM